MARPWAVDIASGTERCARDARTRAAAARSSRRWRAALADAGRRPRAADRAQAGSRAYRREAGQPAGGRAPRERDPGLEHPFGPYGGQFVPETLMPALAELEQAWRAARADAGYRGELARAAAGLRRQAHAAVSRHAPVRARRAAACTSSARTSTTPARTSSTTPSARCCWPAAWASGGSSPRPAPASTASRRRPCARCWGSSASSTWASRTRVRQRPNVQRMQLLGRDACEPVDAGAQHAQGGHLGGDPRLGGERREHPLRDRLGRGPGALPGAGAGTAAGDRRGGARADARARGAAARARGGVRRRRLERDRHVRGLHSPTSRSSWSGVEAAGEGIDTPRHGAPLTVGGARACCTGRARR